MGEGVPRGEPAWRGEGGGLLGSIYVLGGILLGAAQGSHSASAHAQTHVRVHSHTLHSNICAHTVTYMHRVHTQKHVHNPHRCASTHVHSRVYAHTVTHVQTRLHSHTHVATLTFTHTCIRPTAQLHMCTEARGCVHAHIHHTHTRTHRLPIHEWLVGKRQEGARLPWQHILEPDQAWLVQLIWQAVSRWGLLRTPTRTKLVREQLV